MMKFRLAAAVALLVVSLMGTTEKKARALNVDPWCQEDFNQCVQSGQDFAFCACYREMCMGRDCP